MKPFLLLATRADDAAAEGEYQGFLRFGGLAPDELHRVRVEQGPLPPIELERYSGIFVGGSPYNSSDPEEEKSAEQRRVERELGALLDEVVAEDFPFLGACYGVGTLGRHQGAVIDRTFGEPVGAATVTLSGAGAQDPLLEGVPEAFTAFVGHKEACATPPVGAVVLASSPACPIQMFRIKENLYATQFHPELDVAGILTRIDVYKYAGYFAPDEAESLRELVRSSAVRHPPALVRRFVERYAAPTV